MKVRKALAVALVALVLLVVPVTSAGAIGKVIRRCTVYKMPWGGQAVWCTQVRVFPLLGPGRPR